MTAAPSLETERSMPWSGVLGLVLFVAGVVGFPVHHAIHHQNDHVHGVTGVLAQAFEHDHGHSHEHVGAEHEHVGAEHEHEHDRRDPNPQHGQGSLEHLGVALLAPVILLVPPSFACIERQPLPERVSLDFAREPYSPRQSRAPPA